MHQAFRFGVVLMTLLLSMALPTWAVSQTMSPTTPAISRDGSVPECPTHDPNTFHALYDPVRNCHYNHEHHDDPNTVNDLFGPPGAWFGQPGLSISYPWQTFNDQGVENQLKHQGYKWVVARDLPCGGDPGCIVAFRIQAHAIAGAMDATVRFHSFSMEALACPDGRCGIIRHAGWNSYGHLALATSQGDVCPPLPTNPATFTCGGGPRRVHSSLSHFNFYANWYGDHHVTQPDLHFLEFGPIDANDPNAQLFFPCPGVGCNFNGSVMRIENLLADLRYPWMNPDANGLINFRGYTDRYGDPVDGAACTAPSVDCVPLEIVNLPAGRYGMPRVFDGDGTYYHDTSPASQQTGNELWIKFPN
jgi:hypothetical protein